MPQSLIDRITRHTYATASTRTLLIMPDTVVAVGDSGWTVLQPDARGGRPHETNAIGGAAFAYGDRVACLAAGSMEAPAASSWMSWPDLRAISSGPDVAAERGIALIDGAADGSCVAWIPRGADGYGGTITIRFRAAKDPTKVAATGPRVSARDVGQAVRLVINKTGTYAAAIHAGGGVVVGDRRRRRALHVPLATDGRPFWGAIHPTAPLAVVFARDVHVVQFRSVLPPSSLAVSSTLKSGGEFTRDGKWLLFVDAQRIYGMRLGDPSVRAIDRPDADVEDQPLRLSFDGQLALVSHAGCVAACGVQQLVEALEHAPSIGRLERVPTTDAP